MAVIKADPRHQSRERINDPALLEPVTRRKVEAIVADAASKGVKVCIYETYRSQARQAELFDQGVTQLRHVGVHGFGLAADLVPLDSHGEPTWDAPQSFRLIAHLAHVHNLVSGADWGHPERSHRFIDQPHVQRVAVDDQDDLFAGTWYPDDGYDPYDS